MDVVNRLAPFVIELERSRRPVVIVSHLSTLQVLLAYFKGIPVEACVDLAFPMNTLVEFTPHQVRCSAVHPADSAPRALTLPYSPSTPQYGWLEKRYAFTKAKLDPAASSTHIVW